MNNQVLNSQLINRYNITHKIQKEIKILAFVCLFNQNKKNVEITKKKKTDLEEIVRTFILKNSAALQMQRLIF